MSRIAMSRRDPADATNSPRAADSDDEFGEFEGAVGGIAAHPAPTPWAAFPDLIRVRTSPGATANMGSEGGPQHAEAQGDNPSGPRVRNPNPPDVSLHSREAASDDVNLLNYIPSSHQRVGGALPDMAAESELRHTMQVSSSLSPAAREHIAEVRPTLRGSPHDAGSSARRGSDQPGTLASMAANVQRTSALCRSGRSPCGRENCPDSVDAAALRESNAALTRRLSASESRVRDLESQLRDLREREARSERSFQLVVNELHAIRETLMSLDHASRAVAERLEGGSADGGLASANAEEPSAKGTTLGARRRASVEERLSGIEASLDRLYSRLPNICGRADLAGDASAASPATYSLSKEDITQAVQEALLRQSTQQKALLEEERRRLMQSFAESFQVAISQFLQSLNSDNLDS